MRGEFDGVGGRLGAAVDGDLQPPAGCVVEALDDPLAFGDREEDPLARRPEREQAADARAGEEIDVRLDGLLVDGRTVVAERRQRRGQSAPG
jgi:hypothetical protein